MRLDALLPSGFKDLMDASIERMHAAPTVEVAEPMRYPGEREDSIYKERSADGIPLHPGAVEDL